MFKNGSKNGQGYIASILFFGLLPESNFESRT